jgi:hypothetical protein
MHSCVGNFSRNLVARMSRRLGMIFGLSSSRESQRFRSTSFHCLIDQDLKNDHFFSLQSHADARLTLMGDFDRRVRNGFFVEPLRSYSTPF